MLCKFVTIAASVLLALQSQQSQSSAPYNTKVLCLCSKFFFVFVNGSSPIGSCPIVCASAKVEAYLQWQPRQESFRACASDKVESSGLGLAWEGGEGGGVYIYIIRERREKGEERRDKGEREKWARPDILDGHGLQQPGSAKISSEAEQNSKA